MKKKTSKQINRLLKGLVYLSLFLFLSHGFLYTQDSEDETIQLREEKETDLDIQAGEAKEDLIFLKDKRNNQNQKLFNESIDLETKSKRQNVLQLEEDEKNSSLYFLVGNGFFFLGGLDFKKYFENSLLEINFKAQSRQSISSLTSPLSSIVNSKKNRFDLSANYILNGNHKFSINHSSYLLGLQDYQIQSTTVVAGPNNNSQKGEILFYDFDFAYDGYYRFSGWILQNYLSLGGGNYTLNDERGSGYLEFNTELYINIKEGAAKGVYTDIIYRLTWLENSQNFRFLIGGGIGYIWEVTPKFILDFELGHTAVIKAGKNTTRATDYISPILSKTKFELTYRLDGNMVLGFVTELKTDIEQMKSFYASEPIVEPNLFSPDNRLFEGAFLFKYENINILKGLKVDAKAFYDFFFKLSRFSYQPNTLKKIQEEKGIHQVGMDVLLDIGFLDWLSLYQQTIYKQTLSKKQFFPQLQLKSSLNFDIASIYSRFFLTHLLTLGDRLYSPDGNEVWSMTTHSFNIGYDFKYKDFVFQILVENIFNTKNTAKIPFMVVDGRSIKSGIIYKF